MIRYWRHLPLRHVGSQSSTGQDRSTDKRHVHHETKITNQSDNREDSSRLDVLVLLMASRAALICSSGLKHGVRAVGSAGAVTGAAAHVASVCFFSFHRTASFLSQKKEEEHGE